MQKLNSDGMLAKQMGQAARDRYETLFTGALIGERYAQVYESLLSAKSVNTSELISP